MKYYVHTIRDERGDHEVHTEQCAWLPKAENREYLGVFANCHSAVLTAKVRGYHANGCYHCCRECHTS